MTNTTAELGAAAALTPHTPLTTPGIRVLDAPRSLRQLASRGVDVTLAVDEPGELEIILSARIRNRDGRLVERGHPRVLLSDRQRSAALRGRYQRLDRAVVRPTEAGQVVTVRLKPSPIQRLALRSEHGLLAQLDVRRRETGDRPELRRRLRFT